MPAPHTERHAPLLTPKTKERDTNSSSDTYDTQGKYTEAEPLYLRALAIREKLLEPDDPYFAQSLNNLALLYYRACRRVPRALAPLG